MRAAVAIDSSDNRRDAELVHASADVQAGRVLCEITPGRRTLQRLAGALLVGLGKDPGITGGARNAQEEWRRAAEWVAGEQPAELIVWRAHLLPRSHWEHFLDLPLPAQARLWLIVNGTTTSRGQREAMRDHRLADIPFEEFRSSLRGHLPTGPVPNKQPTFPSVPEDEFPLFLERCQEVLSAAAFQTVAREYWRAFKLATDWATSDRRAASLESELQLFTAELLRGSTTLYQMLVALRGAQAALFGHGYLLGVDLDALASGYANTPCGPLDDQAARRLRRLSAPHLAAVAVVALLTVPDPRVLSHLNLPAIDPDGAFLEVAGQQLAVPQVAQGILRAHLAHRHTQGASDADPLFVSEGPQAWSRASLQRTTPHGIQQRLRQVAQETGVPVSTSEGWLRTDKRWLKRRGITLRELERAA